MLSALVLSLAVVPSAPAPAAAFAPAPQDEAAIVDERPEIKAKLDELAEHVKAKGEKDAEAIGKIDELLPEFASSGPKDRAAIVKALADCFDAKRTKELEEG